MTAIIIKPGASDTAGRPEGPGARWEPGSQVVKHEMKAVDPGRRLPGVNQWGQPEGVFVYGRDRTVQEECVVDFDIAPKYDKLNNATQIAVLGVHIMCPRCYQPLYIRTPDSPAGAGRIALQVEVHWSDRRCCKDGYWRPTFSVGAPFRCENAWRTSKRANPDTAGLCNWRGGVLRGLCLDHWS